MIRFIQTTETLVFEERATSCNRNKRMYWFEKRKARREIAAQSETRDAYSAWTIYLGSKVHATLHHRDANQKT